jgi:hypothetical protein
VVWFGAVGGLLVSLSGILYYNYRKWDPTYDYWHYCRPLVGAFIGTIGSLLFVVLADAAATKAATPNVIFYDVIAFALGFREESFRSLLTRLTDTVIGSGDQPAPGNTPAPQPPSGA